MYIHTHKLTHTHTHAYMHTSIHSNIHTYIQKIIYKHAQIVFMFINLSLILTKIIFGCTPHLKEIRSSEKLDVLNHDFMG